MIFGRDTYEFCWDGTQRGKGYCGVGKCNIFGCKCKGGCRRYDHKKWVELCNKGFRCETKQCTKVMADENRMRAARGC